MRCPVAACRQKVATEWLPWAKPHEQRHALVEALTAHLVEDHP